MELNTSYTKIITDENLMETIQHGDTNYPFHYYYENVALYNFHCVDWHWHTELEYVYIESGTLSVWIGETQFELSEGSGIFINSKVLHRFSSPFDTFMPNFVFMPSFIAPTDSLIYQKYVLPIVSSSLQYIIFQNQDPRQEKILSLMRQIQTVQDSYSCKELQTLLLIQELWLEMFKQINISCLENRKDHSYSSYLRLQLMMQFIHRNYSKNITLEDIAGNVMVSKSTALNLFKKYLHTTPINYLIFYRLKQSARLLSESEKKISTISYETGFRNVDYFCKIFKRYYRLTPTEYRSQGRSAL